MECSWVEDRLVALQDDELSRSERELVEEHLEHCPACADLEAHLAAVSPEPCLQVPADVQARLESAVSAALDEALAAPVAPRSVGRIEQTRRWLRRDRDLSNGAMLAYAAALAICLGWGMSNWLALPGATQPTDSIARVEIQSTVRSDHYQPASYAIEADTDEDEEEYR